MSANVPPGNNLSLESVFSNAREESGVMTHERVRMFLQAGDPPPDGPDDADLENPVYKKLVPSVHRSPDRSHKRYQDPVDYDSGVQAVLHELVQPIPERQ
jgi:hypothetical protein